VTLPAEKQDKGRNAAGVLVVIVNYKTPALTVNCLRSLQYEQQALPGARVTVVDNASGDGSPETIEAAIRENEWQWASVLPLEENLGFAGGNNAAIRPALQKDDPPELFWLLNPDTIVHPGALKELVSFLDHNRRAGIAGSLLQDAHGRPQSSARRFPGVLSEFESSIRFGPVSRALRKYIVAIPPGNQPVRADWAPGASMMVRKEVFEGVGLFDEGYFLYYEEVDFCLRAASAGWECWCVPESRVMHLEGQATGIGSSKEWPKRRPRYWFEARRRYFRKNLGALRAFLADIAWLAGHAAYKVKRRIKGEQGSEPPHIVRDFLQCRLSESRERV